MYIYAHVLLFTSNYSLCPHNVMSILYIYISYDIIIYIHNYIYIYIHNYNIYIYTFLLVILPSKFYYLQNPNPTPGCDGCGLWPIRGVAYEAVFYWCSMGDPQKGWFTRENP